MKHSHLSVFAAFLASAVAKTIVIDVGQSGLSFSPSSTTASVGDVLEFHFFGTIHTAVQSDFDSPCQQSSSGFNSGDIDDGDDGKGSVFQVTVKDTNPIWYFCGTPGHCQAGMAGVINPPSSGDSLDSYKSAAAGTSTKAGDSTEGGVVVAAGSSSSSTSTSSSSAASIESSTTGSSSVTPTSSSSLVVSSTESSSASATSSESKSAAIGGTTVSTSKSPSTTATLRSSDSTSLSSPTPVTSSGGEKVVGMDGIVNIFIGSLTALLAIL